MTTTNLRQVNAAAGLCAITLCIAATALAAPIYSNQSPSPSAPALATLGVSTSGVASPPDGQWCELQASGVTTANAIAGFSGNLTGTTGAYRFADNFTVTDPLGWRVDLVEIFAYQTGANPLVSPISAINVRLWSGRPGDVGSAIIFGDTTSNRMTSTSTAPIYRIFNSTVAPAPIAPDTSRKVWRASASLGSITLPPGTYWVDWQLTSAVAGAELFVPAVTQAGVRTAAGWNARQFKTNGGGSWVDAVDTGKPSTAADAPQDFPFIIYGTSLSVPPCYGDANGDNIVNGADLSLLLSQFGSSVPAGTGADLNHDAIVNGSDLSVMLSGFGTSC